MQYVDPVYSKVGEPWPSPSIPAYTNSDKSVFRHCTILRSELSLSDLSLDDTRYCLNCPDPQCSDNLVTLQLGSFIAL